jgi:8-amino-3,8-dideoxy-alpha-D-manno-octulosonate transaminase
MRGDIMEKLATEGGPKTIPGPMPFAGFGAEFLGKEEEDAILEALRKRALCRIAHPLADSFAFKLEEGLRERLGTQLCVAVNSGASALHAAMVALEIGPGDEVLVSSAGWVSLATAVINVGAVPVMVDTDESLSMDTEDLRRKVTPRSRAIIVVHWRGLPANMGELLQVAAEHDLKVVEDCAQSFGGQYDGRYLGTVGDVGCYSFNVHKVITGGEGGALVCKDPEVFRRAVSFSGMYRYYRRFYDPEHSTAVMPLMPMLNLRLPELCAAMAWAQLPKLDRILGLLRARRDELVAGLKEVPALTLAPRHDPAGEVGYTLPLVFADEAAAGFFMAAMRAEGATNVSNFYMSFGGGESRGTAAFVQSEGLDLKESGQMGVGHTWHCVTQQIGVTEKLNPWRLAGAAGHRPPPPSLDRTVGRLKKVVALKTNVQMTSEHTALTVKAAAKVAAAMAAARG